MKDFKGVRCQEYYVCFGGRKTFWWTRFLKKGFHHCFLLGLIRKEEDLYVLVDHVWGLTDIAILKDKDVLKKIADFGYVPVPVKVPEQTRAGRKGYMFIPFTCVETVKHFLGINTFKVITPYQLFKYIAKKGK